MLNEGVWLVARNPCASGLDLTRRIFKVSPFRLHFDSEQESEMKSMGFVLAIVAVLGVVPTPALAYPGGTAISSGSNPVRSAAGRLNLATESTATDVLSAPADHDLILTDISFGLPMRSGYTHYSGYAEIQGSDGVLYGVYTLTSGRVEVYGTPVGSLQFSGSTGVRIPAGVSISVNWVFTFYNYSPDEFLFTYTLAGYLAEP